MSLRARLLLAVGVVLLVALAATDLAVQAELRASLFNQVNSSLRSAGHSIQLLMQAGQAAGRPFEPTSGRTAADVDHDHGPAGAPGPGSALSGPPTAGTKGPAVAAGAPAIGSADSGPAFCDTVEYNLAPGYYVEVRDPAGNAVSGHLCPAHVNDKAFSPVLPRHFSGLVPPSGERPAPPIFFTAASTVPSGPAFQVTARALPAGSGVLVVAAPLSSTDRTLEQLLSIELVVSGAALVVGTLLGWLLVHLDLRPLRDIERTAGAIAAGELESRVPGANQRTEVGHVAAALNVMLTRIEQAFAERDANEAELRASEDRLRRFVADASHELRTPIAAVSAYAELFEQGAASHAEDLERAMGGIRTETARMGQLVEDLLLLARLDEKRPLELQPIELVGMASEAIETARAVGPRWPVHLAARDSVETLGDPLRLRQVLDNLLANVRAHTPPGTEATVAVGRQGGEAVIEVSDNGPGLEAEHRRRIFDRFYRADPSRARSRGGAGLGLSIVASIVAAHRGSVEVGSEPGSGTTFSVRLPLHLDGAGEREDDERPSSPGGGLAPAGAEPGRGEVRRGD